MAGSLRCGPVDLIESIGSEVGGRWPKERQLKLNSFHFFASPLDDIPGVGSIRPDNL